ncbi:MAG: hypothetical protein IID42_01330 [Planctomycetes bacterium]|nr:hypothetical protein [Planctomycetota bacterium]
MTKTVAGRIVGIVAVSWGSFLFGADNATTEEQAESTRIAYRVTGGTVELHFSASMLDALGWKIVSKASEARNDLEGGIVLPINKSSTFRLDTSDGVFDRIIGGSVTTFGALLIEDADNASRIVIGNFGIGVDEAGRWSVTSATGGTLEFVAFEVPSVVIDFTANAARLNLVGELIIAEEWAQRIGRPELARIEVGVVRIFADMAPADQVEGPPGPDDPTAQGNRGTSSGPDVIVGHLPDVGNYGSSGDIAAFSVGTTSCNIGDQNLNWIAETNEHPVIAQNMYKLQGGRLTCIGQSWLKHGFFALSGNLCSGAGGCSGDPSGNSLGVGCSDPYTAGLNGSQGNLGPRSQVNPLSGLYPYPFSAPDAPATIGRRLQVHHEDLEPSLNPGALYFVEGHYIARDDALARNAFNNASYRRIIVSGGGSSFSIALTGSTQREQPAIQAWADFDPDATVVPWSVPGGELFWLATKVTDKGDGWFLYDYAVHNLNSDRAASAFSVPLFPGTLLRNIGFHDVDSHSGEPYELTDWEVVQSSGLLTWRTEDCQTNPDTNALRWGTMYNFWFEARKEPDASQTGEVLLRLCKTNNPDTITKNTTVPAFTSNDCNDNGVPDEEDIANGTSEDCTGNLVPDECEGDDDGDGIWNPCDICNLGDDTLDDDSDGVPDACDTCPGFDDNLDFDGDGVADGCDNCPFHHNPSQANEDGDALGDACDPDFCEELLEFEHFDLNPVGWAVEDAGATDGHWTWGFPVGGGDRQDPPDDFDGGGGCYLTDNVDGNSDVDAGTTRLLSPVYDLSTGEATLSYAYWIGTTDAVGGDSLVVEVTDNGGSSWTPLATYNDNREAWLTDSFVLTDFVTNTETVQLRFSATDGGTATVMEAGIDAVEISISCAPQCSVAGDCEDFNGCTIDSCDNGFCSYQFSSDPCDDGDECTTDDMCIGGICTGGDPPPCTGIDCTDCNRNGFKDQCEGLPDCNNNGIPDGCEFTDCNVNGVADVCDIALGKETDCDGGPVGDPAFGDLIFNTSHPCSSCHGPDGSGGLGPDIRDYSRVQIWNQVLPPTTHTGGAFTDLTEQDFADIEAFLSTSGSKGRPNLFPDECEQEFLADCDENGVTDGCELDAGTQTDLNFDGLPDECTIFNPPTPDADTKNRYISFTPGTLISGAPGSQAFRVTSINFPSVVKWVAEPDAKGVSLLVCQPFYKDWGGTVVQVADRDIIPDGTYSVEGIVEGGDIADPTLYTDPVFIETTPEPTPKKWADIVGVSDGVAWSPPNRVTNFDDVFAAVKAFQADAEPYPPMNWADVEPEVPNRVVNIADVFMIVLAFQGEDYPFGAPAPCP